MVKRPSNLAREPLEHLAEDGAVRPPYHAALSMRALKIISYMALNATKLALNMFAWFLCAAALDPTEMGYWTIFSLVMVYGPFCAVGVLSGLGREMPHDIGAGQKELALAYAGAASWFAWRLAFVFILAIAGFSAYAAVSDIAPWYVALAYGGMAGLVFPTYHARALLRTSQKFQSLGLRELLGAVVGLLLVSLVHWFGLAGMAIRGLGLAIVNLTVLTWQRPYSVVARMDMAKLRHLARVGLPIDGTSFAHSFVESLDVTLLAIAGGPASVGLYALARATMNGLRVLPISIGTMFYPKMCEAFGRTSQISSQIRLVVSASGFLLLLSVPAAFGVSFILDIVVPEFLPKYVDGLVAAKWIIWSIVFNFASPFGDMFTAIRRLDLYFAAIVLGGIGFAASFVIFLDSGTIAYVAAAQAVLVRAAITSVTQIALATYLFVRARP